MALKLKKSKEVSKVGEWSFLGGVIFAAVAGIIPLSFVPLLLAVLGILVGLINIGARETHEFLLAGVALIVVASTAGFGLQPILEPAGYAGIVVANILANIVSFVAPATAIVALKAVYEHGR